MAVKRVTPKQFKAAMEKEIKIEIPSWQAAHHIKLHLQLVNELIANTPVGNPDLWKNPENRPKGYAGGRARGNWQSSLVGPPPGETGQLDSSGAGTLQANTAAINGLKPFTKSWITNNVPYILVLNDGLPPGNQHTKQVPLLWVETAVEKVTAQFD
jgi:hypothetical protein